MIDLKKRRIIVCLIAFIFLTSICTQNYLLFAENWTALYEAENGTLNGTNVSHSRPGYSGMGYVTGFDIDGDSLAINVNAPLSGMYNLMIDYASEFGDKTNDIYVNGNKQLSVAFRQTSSFTKFSAGKVFLDSGTNEIKIAKNSGLIDVNYIEIEQLPPEPALSISASLVNPYATKEAKSLMSYLSDNYGKKIISGQQGLEGTNWLDSSIGKKPALTGFDFMDYSPSKVQFVGSATETEKALTWWGKGGIVAFSWLWNAPADLINQPEKGYYAANTTFDLSAAINNPGSDSYNLLLRDIDAIAVQLKKLQEAGVPVLWKPLQNAQSGLYWWGSKGPDACRKLYLLMYDRLTNYHKLNNLIWVWTSSDNQEALNWYPGDQYVDIIGADIKLIDGDNSAKSNTFWNLVSLYNRKKLVTMSENGSIPDPDKLIAERAGWSWFCTGNTNIYDSTQNSWEQIIDTYNNQYVITLDRLPDLRNYKDISVTSVSPLPTLWPSPSAPSATATATNAVSSQTPTPLSSTMPTAISSPTPSYTKGFDLSGFVSADFAFTDHASPLVRSGFTVSISGTSLCALTDTNGEFHINNVQFCSSGYTVTISKTGFLYREIKNVVVTGNTKISSYSSPIFVWGGDMPEAGEPDNAINMGDVVMIASRFGTKSSDPRYVDDYDLDKDNAINISDIMIIAKHFNSDTKDYPPR